MSWEDLKSDVQRLLADSSLLQNRLRDAQSQVSGISIYRPLRAFRTLRDLSSERDELRAAAMSAIERLAKVVMTTPDKTMGETLTSCLDTIRFSAEIARLQAQSVELDGSMQQTGAFAFAVFALYVSLVSLFATVLLGVLSLIR